MTSVLLPELLLQILDDLPLRDLISATHVNKHWRALGPNITSPTRIRLLSLAFERITTGSPTLLVSLPARQSYVKEVENTCDVLIPEPYRTLLTEWPSSHPPLGMHWPHSVRSHASGLRFCFHSPPDSYYCADKELEAVSIIMPDHVLSWVIQHATVPPADKELFHAPPRLHTEAQNAQTLRFIRAHPATEWTPTQGTRSVWMQHKLRALRLSRYSHGTGDSPWDNTGIFVMMLDGPTRGQIHGWRSRDGYDGFEAETFWDWKYEEWDLKLLEAEEQPPDEEETSASRSES